MTVSLVVKIGAREDKSAPATYLTSARQDLPDSGAARMDSNGRFEAIHRPAPNAVMHLCAKLG